jgi:copper chaperone
LKFNDDWSGGMAEQIYTVAGMTCAHCVAAVTAEVASVTAVDDVTVALDSGRLVVRGEGVESDAVRAAVEEAGYSLV